MSGNNQMKITDIFMRAQELGNMKETNLNIYKESMKEDELQKSNDIKTEATLKKEKFEKEYKYAINKKQKMMMSAPYTNNINTNYRSLKINDPIKKPHVPYKRPPENNLTNFSNKKEENIFYNMKKFNEIRTSKEEEEKERRNYEAQKKNKLSIELVKKKQQKEIENNIITELHRSSQSNPKDKPHNATQPPKRDGSFLFDHFGEENIQRAREEEMLVVNKNRKLQNLLVSSSHRSDISQTEQTLTEIDLSMDLEQKTHHIGPIRMPKREEDIYRYFKFNKEEILEKSLDFAFYKDKTKSNLGNNEHIVIPDKFSTYNHYKYVWLNNFFYELKHCLLSGKLDNLEKQKYYNAEVKIILLNKRELYNSSSVQVFNCNPNKKLDFQKLRIFKENDIFAMYREEDFGGKDKVPELGFDNRRNLPYFIAIVSYEKNLNNDSNDMLFKVHSKCSVNIKENCSYSLQILGNLTSSLREYSSLIEMDSWNISEALLNPMLFYTRKLNELSLSERMKTLPERVNNYISNINFSPKFNESQKEAIRKISLMSSKDLFLIQGPPGTGKTHTIIGIISLLYLENPKAKILICAPSNAAIDEISIRIAKAGLLNENLKGFQPDFVRFGLYDRLEKEAKELHSENGKILKQYSIEKLIETKFRMKEKNISEELDKITFTIEQLEKEKKQFDIINFNKNLQELCVNGINYTKLGVSQRIQEISRDLKEMLTRKKDFTLQKRDNTSNKKLYERELLEKYRILCTTLNSSGNERLRAHNISYEYLIIDEACQCVEPSSIIPFALNVKKVIMVGDHMQLPATVFSDKATQLKYNRSLFERMIDNNYPRHILTTQYRMETSIRDFVGKTYYEGKLQDDHETMKTLRSSSLYEIIDKKFNFSFFDLNYSSEKLLQKSKSYVNNKEAGFIVVLLKTIQNAINEYNRKANEKSLDFFGNFSFNPNFNKNAIYLKYAIIAPYKAQVKDLTEEITNKCPEMAQYVEVNTVDSFQGREQDIVLISTVRSNKNPEKNETGSTGIGFLNDYRRMNVALSRAKLACFVVGNASTLIQNEYWQKLIDHCLKNDCLFPIREEYLNLAGKKSNLIENILKSGTLMKFEKKEMEEGECDGNAMSNFSNFNNFGNSNLNSICSSDDWNLVSGFKNDLVLIRNMNKRYKAIFNNADISMHDLTKEDCQQGIQLTDEHFLGRKCHNNTNILEIEENEKQSNKIIKMEHIKKNKTLIKKNPKGSDESMFTI